VSELHFSIDQEFPMRKEFQAMLESFKRLFTDPFTSRHLLVDPFKIELVPDARLKRAYPRRVAPPIQQKVDEEVTRLLDLGIIRPSNSRVCFPIVVAKKPDGSIRLCVDYSELNKWTVPLRFPMPEMELLLQRLTGKKFFSKLDLTMGYHQWLVDENSIPLTAFVTQTGLYEYTRVPFGCMNAPNGFQQKMREILQTLDGVCCEVYMDDILIYGDTPAEIFLHTKMVLSQLDAYNVLVKPSKCMFGLQELQFLGHVITSKCRKLSSDRVQKVLDMAVPKSVKQLRTFLGLANAFRDYIPNFAMMQKRLSELCKVNRPFTWSADHTRYVEETKLAVSKAPANFHVTYKDPLVLQVDASDEGVGGVLLQIHMGEHQPIQFFSHAFSDVAKRWSTIEQEAYAIYYGILKCENYLLCYPFTLMTDHQNLVYIYKATAPKVVRWRLRLQMFQFTILHIPGSLNSVADALSRLFVVEAEVKESKRKRQGFPELPDFSPVIPQVCFDKVHNSMVGHHGATRTRQLLKAKGFEWPNMGGDILHFIAACPICQKLRHSQGSVLAALATTTRSTLFECVAVDTIGPLPVDEEGNMYLIVMVCCFSRFVEIEPCKDTSALSAAKALLQLVGRYGIPGEIQSDQGPQFASQIVDDLMSFLKTSRRFTLPYRPQANGIVERANQETMKHLKAIVYEGGVKRYWSMYTPLVQRIMNNSVHSSIGTTPSRVVFGDRAYLDRGFDGVDRSQEEGSSKVITYEDHIQELNEQLKVVAAASARFQKTIFDERLSKGPKNPTTFDVGSLVLVSYPERPPDKLTSVWRGPLVVQRVEKQTYFCQDLISLQVSPFFVDRLKRFTSDDRTDPAVLAALDKDELQVQSIVGHRGNPKDRKNMTFRVRWVGQEPEDDSWEPWDTVKKLQALDTYIEQHKKLRSLRHTRVLKMNNRDRTKKKQKSP
jgi:transposase InsO family protein